MPVLTVGNQSFNYPANLTESGWGDDATGWAEAVTQALSAIVNTGDILQTSFAVQNNISTLTNIVGLNFNSGVTRAANISYAIYRVSNTNPGVAESGVILLDLNDTGSTGQRWQMTVQKNSESGVTFSVTDSGQIQYLSNDIGIAGYTGTMKFSAKTLSK